MVPLDSPYVQAAARAIERGFGRPPVFIREGGSIPIVTAFSERLGVDTLLLGWGLDDDNTHSPNEKFCLADFHPPSSERLDFLYRLLPDSFMEIDSSPSPGCWNHFVASAR